MRPCAAPWCHTAHDREGQPTIQRSVRPSSAEKPCRLLALAVQDTAEEQSRDVRGAGLAGVEQSPGTTAGAAGSGPGLGERGATDRAGRKRAPHHGTAGEGCNWYLCRSSASTARISTVLKRDFMAAAAAAAPAAAPNPSTAGSQPRACASSGYGSRPAPKSAAFRA